MNAYAAALLFSPASPNSVRHQHSSRFESPLRQWRLRHHTLSCSSPNHHHHRQDNSAPEGKISHYSCPWSHRTVTRGVVATERSQDVSPSLVECATKTGTSHPISLAPHCARHFAARKSRKMSTTPGAVCRNLGIWDPVPLSETEPSHGGSH